MEFFIALIIFLLPPAAILSVVLGPVWAFAPFSGQSRGYSLADLFLLFFVLQYPLLVYKLLDDEGRSGGSTFRATVAGLLCLVFIFLWSRSVFLLNGLGVRQLAKRAAFVVLLVPLVVALSVGFWPFLLASAKQSDPVRSLAAGALAVVASVALALGLRLVVYWVLAGREWTRPPLRVAPIPPSRQTTACSDE